MNALIIFPLHLIVPKEYTPPIFSFRNINAYFLTRFSSDCQVTHETAAPNPTTTPHHWWSDHRQPLLFFGTTGVLETNDVRRRLEVREVKLLAVHADGNRTELHRELHLLVAAFGDPLLRDEARRTVQDHLVVEKRTVAVAPAVRAAAPNAATAARFRNESCFIDYSSLYLSNAKSTFGSRKSPLNP